MGKYVAIGSERSEMVQGERRFVEIVAVCEKKLTRLSSAIGNISQEPQERIETPTMSSDNGVPDIVV